MRKSWLGLVALVMLPMSVGATPVRRYQTDLHGSFVIIGNAWADISVNAANARSTSVLTLPVGATIVYARLYWSAEYNGVGNTATLERRGIFSQAITADANSRLTESSTGYKFYQSSADIPGIVQQYGCAYNRLLPQRGGATAGNGTGPNVGGESAGGSGAGGSTGSITVLPGSTSASDALRPTPVAQLGQVFEVFPHVLRVQG